MDTRDFTRGTKRARREFRKILRALLVDEAKEPLHMFDVTFASDIQVIIDCLALGYEIANSVGLHRTQSAPHRVQHAFFLFHEALNLGFVALKTLRTGSILAADAVLRQALETSAVAFHIAADTSDKTHNTFVKDELNAPKSISVAKKLYPSVGHLYGVLTSKSVHTSLQHVHHSIISPPTSSETGRIRVGASFDTENPEKFKLALIRIEQCAVAIVALSEAGLADYVDRMTLWRRTEQGLEWVGTPKVQVRLVEADRMRRRIEEPLPVVCRRQ